MIDWTWGGRWCGGGGGGANEEKSAKVHIALTFKSIGAGSLFAYARGGPGWGDAGGEQWSELIVPDPFIVNFEIKVGQDRVACSGFDCHAYLCWDTI